RHRARCTHLQTQPGRIQPIDSSQVAGAERNARPAHHETAGHAHIVHAGLAQLAGQLRQAGVDYVCVTSGFVVRGARIPFGPGYL
ncbi:hypothetical protein OMF49_21375, partial [Bordetella pertussis]